MEGKKINTRFLRASVSFCWFRFVLNTKIYFKQHTDTCGAGPGQAGDWARSLLETLQPTWQLPGKETLARAARPKLQASGGVVPPGPARGRVHTLWRP